MSWMIDGGFDGGQALVPLAIAICLIAAILNPIVEKVRSVRYRRMVKGHDRARAEACG